MSDPSDSPEKQSTGADIRAASDQASDRAVVSRRWLLMKAGIALNGLVGLALAVPVVRYLLAPVRRDSSYKSWVSLGDTDRFPVGETRLVSFKNPWTQPWDGQTDNVAAYVRREGASRVHGLRDQLRASWVPGAVVSAVAALHVSVPWRRLLRRWLAGFWTPGARACSPTTTK